MKCIYCGKESSSSKNKAHIVPEALLQNSVTLELGVECDSCNHYAKKLENAFIHHNRIHIPIMQIRSPGKDGKIRKQLGSYSFDKSTNKLKFSATPIKLTFDKYGIHAVFDDPKEFCNLKFRRALYHIAFNYLAWKMGSETANLAKYDQVRNYVRFAKVNEKLPYGQVSLPTGRIRQKLSIGLVENAPGIVVRLQTFADDFYMSLDADTKFKNWVNQLSGHEVLYHDI